jgi:replicative DNA helicase
LSVAIGKYNEFRDRGTTGIITGVSKIDRKIDCLFFGELVVIMARTYVGKTFFALNVLDSIAGGTDHRIGFYSLEMPSHLIYERMAQLYFNQSRYAIKEHFESLHHSGFMNRFRNVLIFDHFYTIQELRSSIIRNNLKVVFVDFLGLLKSPISGSAYERTTEIVRSLKQMAKDLGICLIVLVQLSRLAGQGEVKVTMDMARESGAIEELSDIIIGLWRKGRAATAAEGADRYMTVSLLKNKRGEGCTVTCDADPNTGRIRAVELNQKPAGTEGEQNAE